MPRKKPWHSQTCLDKKNWDAVLRAPNLPKRAAVFLTALAAVSQDKWTSSDKVRRDEALAARKRYLRETRKKQ